MTAPWIPPTAARICIRFGIPPEHADELAEFIGDRASATPAKGRVESGDLVGFVRAMAGVAWSVNDFLMRLMATASPYTIGCLNRVVEHVLKRALEEVEAAGLPASLEEDAAAMRTALKNARTIDAHLASMAAGGTQRRELFTIHDIDRSKN